MRTTSGPTSERSGTTRGGPRERGRDGDRTAGGEGLPRGVRPAGLRADRRHRGRGRADAAGGTAARAGRAARRAAVRGGVGAARRVRAGRGGVPGRRRGPRTRRGDRAGRRRARPRPPRTTRLVRATGPRPADARRLGGLSRLRPATAGRHRGRRRRRRRVAARRVDLPGRATGVGTLASHRSGSADRNPRGWYRPPAPSLRTRRSGLRVRPRPHPRRRPGAGAGQDRVHPARHRLPRRDLHDQRAAGRLRGRLGRSPACRQLPSQGALRARLRGVHRRDRLPHREPRRAPRPPVPGRGHPPAAPGPAAPGPRGAVR